MQSALIELTHFTQPVQAFARWLAAHACNDHALPQAVNDIGPVDPLQAVRLMMRPRRARAIRLSTMASNSDRMVPAALRLASHTTPRVQAPTRSQQRAALRVVVKPAAGTGRMVISGRMADVCAELDRLARAECTG